MNHEKIMFIFCFVFFVFCSCRTTNVPSDGGAAAEVRNDLSEIQSEQSEVAGTAERIDGTSTELEKGLTEAQGTAREREELDKEFKRILDEIRNQRSKETESNPGIEPNDSGKGPQNQ